jgi:hypothetical protein
MGSGRMDLKFTFNKVDKTGLLEYVNDYLDVKIDDINDNLNISEIQHLYVTSDNDEEFKKSIT